jgi:hypothetical protein
VPPVMPADVRRRLEEHFAPATRQLEELLRRTGLEGSSALPVTGS